MVNFDTEYKTDLVQWLRLKPVFDDDTEGSKNEPKNNHIITHSLIHSVENIDPCEKEEKRKKLAEVRCCRRLAFIRTLTKIYFEISEEI